MALAIRRLDLAPWGSFSDRTLHFSGGRGVVELIDGPNAAGKSTIARAQTALLFGIPQRTVDNHTHPYQDLAIGAELLIGERAVEVVRRKLNVGSLQTPAGSALRDDPIPAALGGMGREIYESFFHVDHDTLVRGGEDLLQGKGEIGASLFAAAAGISALQAHLSSFDSRAADIFRPRASSTALAQELARLREREQQLKQVLVRPAAHRRMERELEELGRRSGELLAQITALAREIATLERRLEVAPLINEYTALVARRAELGEVPELAPDGPARRAGAQATLASAQAAGHHHRAESDRLKTQAEALIIDEPLLRRAAELRAVVSQIPVVQKAEADRARIGLELRQSRAEVDVVARATGLSPAALGELARPDSARRQLDDALAEGARLRDRLDAARIRHEAAAAGLTDLRAQSPGHATPADLGALAAGVRAARSKIGLEDGLAEARQRHAGRDRTARHSAAALAPAPRSVGALLALAPLPEDTVERLLTRAQQHREERLQLAADRRGLDVRQGERAALAEELRSHGEVITAAEVHEARHRREASWQGLRSSLGAGDLPHSAVLDHHEATVIAADEGADALARGAARAELARRLAAESARLAVAERQLESRQASLESSAAEVAAEWAQVWSATGLAPIELSSVRDWQRALVVAQSAARDAAEAAATVEGLAGQLVRAEASLRAHLADPAAALPSIPASAGLSELVALAEELIERNAAALSAAAAHAQQLSAAEGEVSAAARELSSAQRNWDGWLAAWPERRAAAGLPAHCSPEQAQDLARAVTEGLAAQRHIDELEGRISGIDRDRDELRQRLDGLLGDVAADLLGRDAWQAAAILGDRLAEAEHRRQERTVLEGRRRDAELAATQAAAAVEAAESELAQLCRAAHCESPDELAAIEARSQVAAELDRDLRDLTRRITERGRDGLETLSAQVADLDPGAAAELIAQLGEERQSVEFQRDGLLERIGQAKLGLRAAEEDTAAVTAAEDLEFSEARIIELAREYALARLSASVIRRAIERYRHRNQNPLVARANELFSRFSEGTYAELFVDVDEKGHGCLVARRQNRVIHTMDQMSKGTREQLFLALRIAAIERYVATSGPVPVLFDDVFVESDDARCGQIFAALGELAEQTQVIVLTHHHHMVAIAEQALGPQLHVQELAAAKAGLRAAA
jgi:uncharacterized protein YhaN